jgi:hypothetical protein
MRKGLNGVWCNALGNVAKGVTFLIHLRRKRLGHVSRLCRCSTDLCTLPGPATPTAEVCRYDGLQVVHGLERVELKGGYTLMDENLQ